MINASELLRAHLATLRRLYHHKLHGGEVTAEDLSRVISALERSLDKPTEGESK